MKTFLLIIISWTFIIDSYSQAPLSTGQDRGYFVQNVISGGLISSINACFNKPKGQSLGKTFVNSFWKGCIGGSLNYAGKKLIQVSSDNNTYAYVWPGRIVNSFGSSIIYNGAKNQKLLQSFNINLFFGHIEFDGNLHFKIDPVTSISSIFLSLRDDYDFNFKNTLLTGSMFFDKKQDTILHSWFEVYKYGTQGLAVGNTIWKKKCNIRDFSGNIEFDTLLIYGGSIVVPKPSEFIRTLDKQVALHEIIHTFQYNQVDFDFIKVNTKISKYLYLNPYFGLAYSISSFGGYRNNIFEKEANYFSY